MKFSVAALALAAVASAQKIGACDGKAQKCIDDAMVGTCDAGDYACACENMASLQTKATPCVLEACGDAAGALEVIGEVKAMCENIGNEPPAEETTPAEEPPAEETTGSEEPPAEETTDAGEEPTETGTPTPPECTKGCNGGGNDTDPEEPEPETPEPTETFAPGAAGAIAPIGALVAGLFALAL